MRLLDLLLLPVFAELMLLSYEEINGESFVFAGKEMVRWRVVPDVMDIRRNGWVMMGSPRDSTSIPRASKLAAEGGRPILQRKTAVAVQKKSKRVVQRSVVAVQASEGAADA
jgi:hypothetical protein